MLCICLDNFNLYRHEPSNIRCAYVTLSLSDILKFILWILLCTWFFWCKKSHGSHWLAARTVRRSAIQSLSVCCAIFVPEISALKLDLQGKGKIFMISCLLYRLQSNIQSCALILDYQKPPEFCSLVHRAAEKLCLQKYAANSFLLLLAMCCSHWRLIFSCNVCDFNRLTRKYSHKSCFVNDHSRKVRKLTTLCTTYRVAFKHFLRSEQKLIFYQFLCNNYSSRSKTPHEAAHYCEILRFLSLWGWSLVCLAYHLHHSPEATLSELISECIGRKFINAESTFLFAAIILLQISKLILWTKYSSNSLICAI